MNLLRDAFSRGARRNRAQTTEFISVPPIAIDRSPKNAGSAPGGRPEGCFTRCSARLLRAQQGIRWRDVRQKVFVIKVLHQHAMRTPCIRDEPAGRTKLATIDRFAGQRGSADSKAPHREERPTSDDRENLRMIVQNRDIEIEICPFTPHPCGAGPLSNPGSC
jgi:hypothetical protein